MSPGESLLCQGFSMLLQCGIAYWPTKVLYCGHPSPYVLQCQQGSHWSGHPSPRRGIRTSPDPQQRREAHCGPHRDGSDCLAWWCTRDQGHARHFFSPDVSNVASVFAEGVGCLQFHFQANDTGTKKTTTFLDCCLLLVSWKGHAFENPLGPLCRAFRDRQCGRFSLRRCPQWHGEWGLCPCGWRLPLQWMSWWGTTHKN